MRATPVVQSLTEPLLSPLVSAISGVFGNGWNPISLFTSGQQGYAYDNNDLSSFYLDSAGTTPATVNGLVGLQLDKSANLALGAELLSTGAVGLTGSATVATYNTGTGAGTVTRVDGANQSFVTFTGLSATTFYKVTIQNTGSNILSFRQGTFASTILGDIGVGETKTFIGLATISQLTITMSPVAGSGSFTVVSFKAQSGNHRYQTTTGSKPVLRGTPTGANLVTNGDFATDAVWTKGTGWSIGSGVATKTAGTASSLFQAITPAVGGVYRITYTLTVTAGAFQPCLLGGTSVFGALRTASGTYVEYLTAATGNNSVGITTNATAAGTVDNIEVVDVSAGSVTAPYALQFDGVDDFLQTAAVNFSATNKITLCNGLRKFSDALRATVIDFDFAALSGSFLLEAPPSNNVTSYRISSAGTAGAVANAFGYVAPITNVVTALSDIGGDSLIIRANGVEVGSATTDQGTGNFGNRAIIFGRRVSGVLPYNGLMFSSVCVGKTVSAIELASIERWVNTRTGAY